MFFPYGEAEIEYLKARDARLGEVIGRIGHVRRAVDDDLFSSVVRHIIGQQISTKAQQTVWRRLTERCIAVTPETLSALSVGELQALGMTFRKAGYIQDFCEKLRAGEFDLAAVAQLPDREAIAALSALKGVGEWTAEMILLFCLQRPDIFSFHDLGIQRGLRMVYRQSAVGRPLFEEYRRRFSPYCSVASLYFWAVAGGAIPELRDPAKKE